MLIFNRSGLLIPDNKIVSNIEELKLEFVDKIPTNERKYIFEKLIIYNENLKNKCSNELICQWIDGSFVTKKPNPRDIDLVTFISHDTIKEIGDSIHNFKHPNSEIIYGVDAYIIEVFPDSHKENFKTILDKAYWMDKFTKTRRNKAGNKLSKGFLEIYY